MKSKSVFFAFVIVLALTLPSLAQEDKLGKVSFPTSCDPKVQVQFERGVAMLHSFWYSAGEKMFRDVLGAGFLLCDRHLGYCLPTYVQPPCRRGFLAQRRGAGEGSNRAGPQNRR